jgi:hypothetical protein
MTRLEGEFQFPQPNGWVIHVWERGLPSGLYNVAVESPEGTPVPLARPDQPILGPLTRAKVDGVFSGVKAVQTTDSLEDAAATIRGKLGYGASGGQPGAGILGREEYKVAVNHKTSKEFEAEARNALDFIADNPSFTPSETSVIDLAILLAHVYNRGVDAGQGAEAVSAAHAR